jgi:HEAT repeat protein
MRALNPQLILSILLLTLSSLTPTLAQPAAVDEAQAPETESPLRPVPSRSPQIIFLDDSPQGEDAPANPAQPGPDTSPNAADTDTDADAALDAGPKNHANDNAEDDPDSANPRLPPHDLETYGLPSSLFDNSSGAGPTVGASRVEQQATIEKAIADLQDPDPEIRRSAVMILGKYRLPDARGALLAALKDPAAPVRQSALVSLLEDQMRLGPAVGIHIANLVDDPDVHIRRLATSALGQVMLRSSVISLPMHARHNSGSRSMLPESIQQKIIQAFQDDDLTVRRNITAAYPILRIRLSDPVLQKLLSDSDREIRMNMLQGLADTWQSKLVELADLLIDDPDDTIRLELANFFNTYNIPAALPYIRQLAQDADFNVSQTAQLTLFQLDPTVETLQPLIQQLGDPRTPRAMATQIVYSIGALKKREAQQFLQQLLANPDPKYLSEVIQLQAALYPDQLQPQTLLNFAEHSSSQIRRSALRALRHVQEDLTERHYQQLLKSRYPGVRSHVADLSSALPPDQAEPLLYNLLLDQEQDVRITALRQITTRKIPGWQQVLQQTLYDPNPDIVKIAILLYFHNPTREAVETLQEFAQQTQNPTLRDLALTQTHRIRQELRDRNAGPKPATPSPPQTQQN